jgi:peptidyl-prolyl cis-trans isomerase D
MLQRIRDGSRSWGAKIIIGVVVAAMALFGVESLVGLFGNDGDEVAQVNGEPIMRHQLEMSVQRAIRSGQASSEQEREVRSEMLDELIDDRVLTQFVEEGGMTLSDTQLDEVIVSLEEFQDQDGRFSQDQFRNRLSSAGYTPTTFRDELRRDLKRRQLQQGLAFSDFTLDSERETLGALQRQTRDLRYARLRPDDLEASPEADETDLERYYEAHADDFRRPEQVRLEYVVIDRERMAEEAEVDEAALRDLWEERTADADRRVSHIMLTFGDERTRDEAEERLREVRTRLEDGESFAELAREVSDDAVSAEQGGDLGIVSEGFFGDAFEEAVFSLEEGEVSDIVETDNGLHLVTVTELDRAPFDEMRDELRRELAREEVDDAFNDRVQQLIDDSFSADDLQSVADDIGLELQTSDWMSRDGADGVLSEPGVMDAAFEEDVLEEGFNSDVIELDDDRRLVLRVAEHREATVPDLDEVREEVRARVEEALRREALVELAAERVEQLRDDEDDVDIDWQTAEDVGRRSESGLPESVMDVAFRLPAPEDDASVYGYAEDGDAVVLIALDRVEDGEVDEEVEAFVARMTERMRIQSALDGLQEHLRAAADIERR